MIEENPKYKGIGGWLLLFCIVLTIITPILSVSQIISGHVNTGVMTPAVKTATIIESVSAVLLHFYGFLTGCIVWSGNKRGNVYAKRFLITNLAGFFVIGIIVALLVDLPDARHKVIGSYIILIPKEIIFLTVWWFYFKKSKRVKYLYENN
jgi:Na+-driven multidrug efflux pump